MSKRLMCLVALAAPALLTGCLSLHVSVDHTPIIARSTESVTFSARAYGRAPLEAQILVNGIAVHSCGQLATGMSCNYTGGPFPGHEGETVSYAATVTDGEGQTVTSETYRFAVTDASYRWSNPAIPARLSSASGGKVDLVFHRADDYDSVDTFVGHAEAKIEDLLTDHVVGVTERADRISFYVYAREAKAAGCGTVHADAASDMPWRDVDAILHANALQDCANEGHFSAEGAKSKAFLHEIGHAAFGLSDEYDASPDCHTFYFQAGVEPNIFGSKAACRAEQRAKRRDRDDCRRFTTCQGDWWGIHYATGGTMMQGGLTYHRWGKEGEERIKWVFGQLADAPTRPAAQGVVTVDLRFDGDAWRLGVRGVNVLPCEAPTRYLTGGKGSPTLRVLDAGGEAVYEHVLHLDPRIVLWAEAPGEDVGPPSAHTLPDKPWMLPSGAFEARFPLLPGMAELAYLPDGERAGVRVDLREAIAHYERIDGADQSVACQRPSYASGTASN